MIQTIASIETTLERRGVILAPSGDARQAAGVLNPASARMRGGRLLLYPRVVELGNISRIARFEATGDDRFADRGYALEPAAAYEFRRTVDAYGPGHGCEDARITFLPALDSYLMAYTAFGDGGPRVALAVSPDGWGWERLGLIDFSAAGVANADDKDAAFFPEPVRSPSGIQSLALYHRPMDPLSAQLGWDALPILMRRPADQRDALRIAYVPLDAALADSRALLRPTESVLVLAPDERWGRVKTGAGTPPVRIDEGWFSIYHATDLLPDRDGKLQAQYGAGIVIHDVARPHIVRYRSPEPLFLPEASAERKGTVDDVVFPTAIDPRPDLAARVFDVYYGMADTRVGLIRLTLAGGSDLTSGVHSDGGR